MFTVDEKKQYNNNKSEKAWIMREGSDEGSQHMFYGEIRKIIIKLSLETISFLEHWFCLCITFMYSILLIKGVADEDSGLIIMWPV